MYEFITQVNTSVLGGLILYKRVIIKMAVIFYNMSKLASGIPNIILSNFILTTTWCVLPTSIVG